MGYFQIGIYYAKTSGNVGTLWRTAYQLGAAGIFTIGRRYRKQSTDTHKTPFRIPLHQFQDFDDFYAHLPYSAQLVGVETGGVPLSQFRHPDQAVYLLGAEDHGLTPGVLERCHHVVCVESVRAASYNVAVAGGLVLYDRVFRTKG